MMMVFFPFYFLNRCNIFLAINLTEKLGIYRLVFYLPWRWLKQISQLASCSTALAPEESIGGLGLSSSELSKIFFSLIIELSRDQRCPAASFLLFFLSSCTFFFLLIRDPYSSYRHCIHPPTYRTWFFFPVLLILYRLTHKTEWSLNNWWSFFFTRWLQLMRISTFSCLLFFFKTVGPHDTAITIIKSLNTLCMINSFSQSYLNNSTRGLINIRGLPNIEF